MRYFYYKFILSVSKTIRSGEVVRSRFATAGPNMTATKGLDGYTVYDDVNRVVEVIESPIGAASRWHKINMEAIKEGRI